MAFLPRYIQKDTTTSCWEWLGNLDEDGYGRLSAITYPGGYTTILAHRYVYSVMTGIDINNNVLHHQCENKKCCNPDHMIITTQALHRAEHIDPAFFPCGHPRIPENLRNKPKAQCRTCHILYMRRRRTR